MKRWRGVAIGAGCWLGVLGFGYLLASDFEDPEAMKDDGGVDAGADADLDASDEGDAVTKVSVVRDNEEAPTEIAVDDSFVYWLDRPYSGSGAVKRAGKDGADPVTVAKDVVDPASLDLEDDAIFFLGGATPDRAIERVDPKTLERSIVAKIPEACAFSVDDKIFYVTTESGSIMKLGAKEKPRTLVAKQSAPCSIAVDDSGVYWANRGSGNAGEGAIMRAERDGKDVTVLASEQFNPISIRLDAGFVYWSNGDGSIRRVNKGAGGVEPIRITSFSIISGLEVDASHLFWTEGSSVWTKKKSEQDAVMIADGIKSARGLALDGRDVYFTDFGSSTGSDGRILKAPRP